MLPRPSEGFLSQSCDFAKDWWGAVSWGPARLEVPDLASVQPLALGAAVLAAYLLFRARWSVLPTLGVCAVLGLLAGLTGVAGG